MTEVLCHTRFLQPIYIRAALIAALIGFFRSLFLLCERCPRTMSVILAFVRGLLSNGSGAKLNIVGAPSL
ncbi:MULTISPECIES: hypothetical protein [Bradyrhizobium]|uniref:hypothetical protein n=1 Tax=Bradyrhizobium elkanii TaxID=29448 RepID=UPI000489FB76|nr:hypothetical protein [Bradyrhizobium elkanii]